MLLEVTDKGKEIYKNITKSKSISEIMSVLSSKEQCDLWCIVYKLRKKGVEYLGLEDLDRYPPENPSDL